MKKNNILLSILGALFSVSFVLYLLLYNGLYHRLSSTADSLIFVPPILVLGVFIVCVWRIFYNANKRFSAALLLPIAVTVIMAVLSFSLSNYIVFTVQNNHFYNNQAKFAEAAEKIEKGQLVMQPGMNTLPAPYGHLVPTDELMLYQNAGKDVYLFVTLDHVNRIEGYLYMPENKLRYEILNCYSSTDAPEVFELDDHWEWVCFYKNTDK